PTPRSTRSSPRSTPSAADAISQRCTTRSDQSRKRVLCTTLTLRGGALTHVGSPRRRLQRQIETQGGAAMSAALVSSRRPGDPRPQRPSVVLLCCDPKAPRIVAAVQVLRELAETSVGTGDDAAGLIARVDADVVVAEEWIGTRDGRALLAWATQTRPTAVGILL